MFSSISRYRRLPDEEIADSRGRVVASKALRLLPETGGRFLHLVHAGDRIDQLAFKYHGQPRDWWRIVDANPEFATPDALLGTDSIAPIWVPIAWNGPEPPWSRLLQRVRDVPGVQGAVLGTLEDGHARELVLVGPVAFDIAVALTSALDASTRTQTIDAALAAALLAEGVVFSSDVRLARLDAVTWRIVDRGQRTVITVEHDPDAAQLHVRPSAFRYEWVLGAACNRVVVTDAAILAVIAGQGFTAGVPGEILRLGKPIVIPPRRA